MDESLAQNESTRAAPAGELSAGSPSSPDPSPDPNAAHLPGESAAQSSAETGTPGLHRQPGEHGGMPLAESGGDCSPVGDQPASADASKRVAGLTDSDRWVLMAFAAMALVLLGAYAARLKGAAETVLIERTPEGQMLFQIDVNEGTWVEWMQLEGIGETLARRIVEDRELNGPFISVDDVQRVKGIGPVTLAKIRPHLRCVIRPKEE